VDAEEAFEARKRFPVALAPSSPQKPREDDNYVAWLHYVHASDEDGDYAIEVCDSDSEGAFKVWRSPVSEEGKS